MSPFVIKDVSLLMCKGGNLFYWVWGSFNGSSSPMSLQSRLVLKSLQFHLLALRPPENLELGEIPQTSDNISLDIL